MIPEEKAKELIEKFEQYAHPDWHEVYGCDQEVRLQNAKACANILCDEVIKEYSKLERLLHGGLKAKDYWMEVKTHINN